MSSTTGKIFKTGYHIDDGDLVFDVYGRNENRKKFHIEVFNTEPYFYTKADKKPSRHNRVKKIERKGRTVKQEKLWKLTTNYPFDVGKIRDSYKNHYEADVRYKDRIRYDYGWKSAIKYPSTKIYDPSEIVPISSEEILVKPRITVADIEVWDKDGDKALDTDNTTEPIVSITCYDSYIDKYCCILKGSYNSLEHEIIIQQKLNNADIDIDWNGKVSTVGDESEILEKYNDWISLTKPDIVAGWNFINYDNAFIKGRSKKLNVNVDFDSYSVFDLMIGNKRMQLGQTRDKLNIQADNLLGIGKLQVPKIYKMYQENKPKLVAYNILDVILTKEINDYMDIINRHQNISEYCGTEIHDCLYQSKIVDSYIFHRISGNIQLPSRDYSYSRSGKKKYKGGHVEEPFTGVKEYVGVVDFKSEYPMVMMEFNISPETYIENPRPDGDYYISPNGNHYLKKPEGIVPQIMRELLEEREEIKKEMREAKANNNMDKYKRLYEAQYAIKVLMNSFYGVLGSGKGTFRLANKKISGDVTAFAREHKKYTSKVMADGI